MLKKLLVSSLCIVGVSFASSMTNFANASIEDDLANICAIVEADDKSELRKKMRVVQSNHSIQLKDYYDGISCNNKSLIRVAITNDASEVGKLLVKRMPKKSLASPEADGKTVLAWIDEQGLSEHPVAIAVKERI
jgi:hypothetical protein